METTLLLVTRKWDLYWLACSLEPIFNIFFFICMFLFAVSSSPVDIPQLKYGCLIEKETKNAAWSWLDVSSPVFKCSEKVVIFVFNVDILKVIPKVLWSSKLNLMIQVKTLLSSLQFSIMKIPVKDVSNCLTKGTLQMIYLHFYLQCGDLIQTECCRNASLEYLCLKPILRLP